jgi:hypothetical protein
MDFSTIADSNQHTEQAAFLAWMQVTTLAEEHFETVGENERLTRKP